VAELRDGLTRQWQNSPARLEGSSARQFRQEIPGAADSQRVRTDFFHRIARGGRQGRHNAEYVWPAYKSSPNLKWAEFVEERKDDKIVHVIPIDRT
jgi:hypothetical protein